MTPAAKRGAGVLFTRLTSPADLENAWLTVLAHYPLARRPPEFTEFQRERTDRLAALASQLRDGRYVPEPAALVAIPKPNHPGEQRQISILRIEDRIVLTALYRVLKPLWERQFLPGNFAYRTGLGVTHAARAVEQHLRAGRRQVAGADIDDFFDSIDRQLLLTQIAKTVWERPIVRLLEYYLAVGSVRRRAGNAEWVDRAAGIAQGSPLSPLLANVYLLPFDRFLSTLEPAWIRYSDNLLLLAAQRPAAEDALARAMDYLQQELHLRVNADSRLVTSDRDGFVFLGFLFQDGQRRLSPSRLNEMESKIREQVRCLSDDSPAAGLAELGATVAGWRRYYAQALSTVQWEHLDRVLAAELRRRTAKPRIARKEWLEALASLDGLLPRSPAEQRAWAAAVVAPPARPRLTTPPPLRDPAAIRARRRAFLKAKRDASEIVLSEPGWYLGRRGERLLIRQGEGEARQIPLGSIRHITLLDAGGSLSAELATEAAARGISIHCLGRDGRPSLRIGPLEAPQFHLSLLQLDASRSPAGLHLARKFVLGKIENQRNLLRYFLKYRDRGNPDFAPQAREATAHMDRMAAGLRSLMWAGEPDLRLERDRIFAVEGQAASLYWRALKMLLRDRAPFEGRVRRGARDLVNSLLNYGYAILYGRILAIVSRSGLNPNISFLHTPREGKPTLVFDLIEEFRPAAVDRVVCALLGRRTPLVIEDDGLTLPTRRRLANAVLHGLQTGVRYHGQAVPLEEVIQAQVRGLVADLESRQPYEPFVMPW